MPDIAGSSVGTEQRDAIAPRDLQQRPGTDRAFPVDMQLDLGIADVRLIISVSHRLSLAGNQAGGGRVRAA